MLGPEQPVVLQMLEIAPALAALEGVAMELDDCAFPLLAGTRDDRRPGDAPSPTPTSPYWWGPCPARRAWSDRTCSPPTAPSSPHKGRALAAAAHPEVKVLVVGNPANTNALIAMSNAKGLDPANFTAMTRLDHNRAVSQLASRLDRPVTSIKKMTIWGNHSSTQYPDLFHCEVDGEEAFELVGDPAWVEEVYIPTVAGRGAAIIAARGASSAASAANAAISHVRDWVSGTPEGDWVSMGVPSDGSYGVPKGLISSFPCVCRDGDWQIVPGLDIDDYSRQRIDLSVAELIEERDAVAGLGLIR